MGRTRNAVYGKPYRRFESSRFRKVSFFNSSHWGYQFELQRMNVIEAEKKFGANMYEYGPVKLKDNKFVLTVNGKQEEFKFEHASRLGEWVAQHDDESGELSQEDFLLMFLIKHFEAMGTAGEGDMNRLKMKITEMRGKDWMITPEHDWEKAHFDLKKIYKEMGLAMPEKEQSEKLAA